jgi:hypothetical protein
MFKWNHEKKNGSPLKLSAPSMPNVSIIIFENYFNRSEEEEEWINW